jgi:hypothetical protein
MVKKVDGHRVQQYGLTAVEVAVVLAVFTIMLVIAWPKFSQWRSVTIDRQLTTAMADGDYPAALRALEKGASPDGWSGSTPHFCLRCDVVTRNDLGMARLVFPPADEGDSEFPRHGPPLLNIAVANDSVEMVSTLLDGGANLDSHARYAYHKYTVFFVGPDIRPHFGPLVKLAEAYTGSGESLGQQIYSDRSSQNWSTLSRVVSLELLEEAGDPGDKRSFTADNMIVTSFLHDAVINDSLEMLHLLILRGADPDLTNSLGETALHLAKRLERTEMVDLLIEAGAYTMCLDAAGEKPEDETLTGNDKP